MNNRLHSLLKAVGIDIPSGLANPLIETIICDSRNLGKGSLFIGLPGENVDGGVFWPEALSSGAVAAIIGPSCAKLKPPGSKDAVVIVPEPFRKRVGELLAVFWNEPSSKISLIGVTGTNGKTTTTHLIDYLTRSVGIPSALFGTLINSWPLHQEVSSFTTDFANSIQEKLSQAVNSGTQIAAMEVSSHALVQHRVAGCHFAGVVFTNLTQDHLDYHDSIESYFDAKSLLFNPPYFETSSGKAVINVDNYWGAELAKTLKNNCWKCSLKEEFKDKVELFISDLDVTSEVIKGRLCSPIGEGFFKSHLIGEFNLMNLLQAVGALLQQGLPLQSLLDAIVDFPGVPGRMERININKIKFQQPIVLVDYAHTPDGLENALIAARSLTKGRLISLFGCGGDRDRSKRSKMGSIAAHFSDLLIVTSDNPRTENPQQIVDEILNGIPKDTQIFIEIERAKAINLAISLASVEDVVLIAGKGHENYQIIGNKKNYFDDRDCARNALISISKN